MCRVLLRLPPASVSEEHPWCRLLHNATDACVGKYFLANTTAVLDSMPSAFQIVLKYKSPFGFDLESSACYICVPEKLPPTLPRVSYHSYTNCMGRGLVDLLSLVMVAWTRLCSWSKKAQVCQPWASWALGGVCEGQGLRSGGSFTLQLICSYLSVSHNSLAPITLVTKHVSQMTMSFFHLLLFLKVSCPSF